MNKRQRFWLYFIRAYSLIHLLRDIEQDLGIRNILSTTLVKTKNLSDINPIWSSNYTYPIEITEIILSVVLLIKNKFAFWGYLTIAIAFVTVVLWSYYWFFL